jgi:hypothetical protein
LETHARRAYAAGYEAERSAAKAILAHIRKGNLGDGFTAREAIAPTMFMAGYIAEFITVSMAGDSAYASRETIK